MTLILVLGYATTQGEDREKVRKKKRLYERMKERTIKKAQRRKRKVKERDVKLKKERKKREER